MLLNPTIQDSLCVGSVGGTEVKSSLPIESGKKKKKPTQQLFKVKVKAASPRSGYMSPAIHIMIQKAISFKCLFALSYFGIDGGNWE